MNSKIKIGVKEVKCVDVCNANFIPQSLTRQVDVVFRYWMGAVVGVGWVYRYVVLVSLLFNSFR